MLAGYPALRVGQAATSRTAGLALAARLTVLPVVPGPVPMTTQAAPETDGFGLGPTIGVPDCTPPEGRLALVQCDGPKISYENSRSGAVHCWPGGTTRYRSSSASGSPVAGSMIRISWVVQDENTGPAVA